MSIPQLHSISTVSIFPDAIQDSAVVVTGIRSQRVSPSFNFVREATSGQPWAHFGAIYSASPMGTFNTIDIARAGAAIGLQGLALTYTGTAGEGGTTFFGVKKQHGGVRASGTVHQAFTVSDGLMFMRSIRAEHGGDAAMDIESMVTYDGQNDPIVSADDSALPTTPDDTHRFTLGKVVIGTSSSNDFELTGKTGVEIDFGVNAIAQGSDSDRYPTHAHIENFMGVLRLTTLDITLLKEAGIPLNGKQVTNAISAIYLRKRSKTTSSGFVADATAEHIKFTPLDGCAYMSATMEGSSGSNAAATIEIPLIGTGSTFPLAVSWASAIT